MSSILITGGAGFIGSHISVLLLEKGFNVCILDSFMNSSKKIIFRIQKILEESSSTNKGILIVKEGDLKNINFVDKVFFDLKKLGFPIKSVIHLAGLKSVNDSINMPLKYWESNINTTLSLLNVMSKYNCINLVFSSSATIYKTSEGLKLKEDASKMPFNPYGKTKLTIEIILKDLFKSNQDEWNIINLRYFNPVGAHPTGLIGENPNIKPTNLFPIISEVAKRNIDKLYIYGKDWPTRDGTCIRDYVHVMDLANAHLAALKFLMKNENQFISINIGTGEGTSTLEIVNKYVEINGVEVPFSYANRRVGDVCSLVADNSLALDLLDWEPTKTINDMCYDSWRWANALNFELM